MDSETIVGLAVLAVGIATLLLLGAAEAGVVASTRERSLREPTESQVDALQRFYRERQLTMSTLALARNLISVAITAISVFLVLKHTDDSWAWVTLTVIAVALGFMLLQALPGMMVAQDPPGWQSRLRPFVTVVRFVFRMPVLVLDAPMGAVMRTWQRGQPGAGVGAEELMLLAEAEESQAGLQEDEREMIRGVMELEFTLVREVMVPRTDIVAIEADEDFDTLARLIADKGLSRIPVYEDDIDHVLGFAHAKELLRHITNGPRKPMLRDVTRDAYVVPETKNVHDLLSEMKEKQISIALVVDEYGGTAGVVTVEDLVEEIVGEIRDEYDPPEEEVLQLSSDEAIVDGRVGIDEINERFDTALQKDDFDSVGGFIINELGRMPSTGDTVKVDGISMKVMSVAGRRIKKVRVTKVASEEGEETADGNGH
ncbi:MAG: HlyC/CorC family transporter [Chloroflexi bacterium]|nr:HlyC/CorC family transporter [Chloroflexota bacterium]MCI0783469.1 HlyC/CorC family transporter [Chloroflexota bacterium]MCI0813814.1 HlyC/CorC family transporter [Chloroflexota bacterium]MCI0817019.1 HlyC/CorC family transporter [Chloroflexota bacterium]MCI0818913.1 HlyC/CorC family transporter [Chloroflexota bacterium]